MTKRTVSKHDILRFGAALLGTLLFCLGVNLFLVPMNFYNGGVVGVAQVIRTLAVNYLHLNISFDLSGVIVYLINIPLFILALRSIGKAFFVKTLICVTFQSLCLSFIPIPASPLIEDPLTACLVGGIISGYGVGLTLRSGSSNGGLDILGLYFTTHKQNFSVGKLAIVVNLFVYGACALLFDVSIVIYSLLFTAIQSFAMDKAHLQNINTEVLIFIKHDSEKVEKAIFQELGRGVTAWNGEGAYTGDPCRVLYVVISKYQLHALKNIVAQIDPKAFVVAKDGLEVSSNFIKQL